MPTVEKHRPRFHFTPPQNWMNDPNGLVYHQGEYHLYYQHNPYDAAWGHMSWGHAVSSNLVHWTHLPIAINEAPERGYTIFSGSAVVDADNASGLGAPGRPALVAIYTADYRAQKLEDVHIAYSTDRGRSFTEYAGNPVIHVGDGKFGDPKVFWHAPTKRWIMANILGSVQGCVALYGSPDLLHWEPLSEFHAPEEAPGIWECPDLFPLAVEGHPGREMWVLKTNCVGPGRHASRYWVGDFDGATFRAVQPALRPRPEDDNFYAEVTYNGLPEPGRRLMFGWLRQAPRPGRGWTGAQSAPRELTLRAAADGLVLCQRPARELAYLRRGPWSLAAQPLTPDEPLSLPSAHWKSESELVVDLELGTASAVGLRLAAEGGRTLTLGLDRAAGELYIEGDGVTRKSVAHAADGQLRLHVLVDRSIVEIFADDGRATLSLILDDDALFVGASLWAAGGAARLARLEGWGLDSAILITDW
jgi:sucrose-6-phosphate hydrolase SacC (GH32 family)